MCKLVIMEDVAKEGKVDDEQKMKKKAEEEEEEEKREMPDS